MVTGYYWLPLFRSQIGYRLPGNRVTALADSWANAELPISSPAKNLPPKKYFEDACTRTLDLSTKHAKRVRSPPF